MYAQETISKSVQINFIESLANGSQSFKNNFTVNVGAISATAISAKESLESTLFDILTLKFTR